MSAGVLERVVKVIVSATGLSPAQRLEAATPLVGAGASLDSVAVLELIVALEKEFGVELDAQELRSAGALATVGSLAEFIRAKVSPPAQ